MSEINGWLRNPRIEPEEGIAATVLFGWAALLLLPYHMFGRGPAFATMEETASELTWGTIGLVILSVFLAGVLFESRSAHLIGLTGLAMWWLFVAGMLYDADGIGPGVIVYGVIGIACLARLFERAGR